MANNLDIITKPDSDRLRHLKLKIKSWEKDFASQNDGKPPSRHDISANPKIAARYSEYQRLKKRLGLENAQTENSQPLSQSVQRKVAITPTKPSARHSETPLKTPSNPFFFTPTSRPELQGTFYSPSASAVRQLKWMAKGYVSPTPQKNGKVLGLFDKLPGLTPTPHKRSREAEDENIVVNSTDSAKTSKILYSTEHDDSDEEDIYVPLDPTTPSRKRRYEFQTPLSKKNKAKSSNEPDPFSTPAIFRQHSMNFELKENGSPLTPELKQFLPNRGMIGKVKPLSTLVRELREMQEEEDPGMDVLRELEQSELNPTKATESERQQPSIITSPTELERQSSNLGAENPTKLPVYKKKGLKRQTKRVRIRPVRVTRTKSTVEESSSSGSESQGDNEESPGSEVGAIVHKTVSDVRVKCSDNESSEEELEAGEISEDELATIVAKPTSKKPPQRKGKAALSENPAAMTKKTTIKADKHANYTRMKMHHKGRGFKGRGRGRR